MCSGVLGNRGNWDSRCTVCVKCRLLSRQLILLEFDHCALVTHLRFQLLQSLRKFFHSNTSDTPENQRRPTTSVVVTTLRDHARTCDRMGCFLEPFSEVRQSSRLRSQVHMSKQLNSCQHNTQAESNEDMKTADEKDQAARGTTRR